MLRTLVDDLLADPNAPGISLGFGKAVPGVEWSRSEWITRGRRFARHLIERGVGPGDRIALVLPTGTPFLIAMLGAWLARASISPLCPPQRGNRRPETELERIRTLLGVVDPRVVIATMDTLAMLESSSFPSPERILWSAEEVVERSLRGTETESAPLPDDIGLIQFSSGSTGIPKGIVLRHSQIRANVEGIGRRVAVTPADSMVSWLPLHHDMGLIGSICCPLGWKIPVRILATEVFASRPTTWIHEISERRATFSPAPASAYDIVARLFAQRDCSEIDLSRWRYAWVGAEPVYPRILERFAATFAASGLRPETLRPCYGLAESTVCATMPKPGEATTVEWIDLDHLRRTGQARAVEPGALGAAAFAGNGRALDVLECAILDDVGRPLGERHEGRIAIRGACVTDGYRGEAARGQNDWLDTGDLGFQVAGEVFVTGRRKDVLIRGGVKVHPHDLEIAAQVVEGVRAAGAAAFSLLDPAAGREQIILAVEAARRGERSDELASRVRRFVVDETGVQIDRVVVVAAGSIPKTTSGKVQRQRARDHYLAGEWSVDENGVTCAAGDA